MNIPTFNTSTLNNNNVAKPQVTDAPSPHTLKICEELKNVEGLKAWMNRPDTMVRMKVVRHDADFKMLMLEVKLYIKHNGKDYERTFFVDAKATTFVRAYFTKMKGEIVDGQLTATQSTMFQRYLRSINLPAHTDVKSLVFDSVNASTDYKLNPFRLVISSGYDKAMLYNVAETPYVRSTVYENGVAKTIITKASGPGNEKFARVRKSEYIRLQAK